MINKLTIVLELVIVAVITEVIAHRDASTSAMLESSDEMQEKGSGRRTLYKMEHEGLPIESPARRMEAQVLKEPEIKRRAGAGRRRKLEALNEGLPLEMPIGRRNLDNDIEEDVTTATTTTSTTPASPPMDPRYRRIYNPDEVASIDDHPYMAALMVNNELWCGAVVIARDSALTAAHCLQLQYNNRFYREYVKMLSLRVGSANATHGGELVGISEIFFHPNYKPQTLEFNVALLKLHKNLTFGRDQPKIELIQYAKDRTVPVDSNIMFLGWGSVLGLGGAGGQVLLQKLEMPVYDLADCQDIYGRELVTRNNFCAGFITLPKNVCNHDAGGPAIMDGVLIGILSFSAMRCDKTDQPAVFSAVGAFAPWLEGISEKKYQLRNTAIKTAA